MPPELTLQKKEDKLYRKAIRQANRSKNVEQHDCSIGPCDVTSKSDLEKLVKDLASKEKYLNLLSPSLHLSSC